MKKFFDSNLFVNNIPTDTTEEEIRKVFAAHGTIISIKLKPKKIANGPSRYMHAFVLYESVEMAQNAIRNLDESRAFGLTPIEVQFWVSRVDLQQEREDRNKLEMKRLIQSSLHDLQINLMGGAPNRRPRGGANGGRGGKPAGQRQARPKSIPKAQPVAKQQFPLVPLPTVDQAALTAITSLEEKKQFIGNAIYPCILTAMGAHAGKITGMLLDEKVVDLQRLLTDQKYLTDLAGEALRLLQQQQPSQ